MNAPRSISVPQVIRSAQLVAIVDVPATLIDEMPDEPLFDSQTAKFLDEVMLHVHSNDRDWLLEHGAKLFVSIDEIAPRPNRVA